MWRTEAKLQALLNLATCSNYLITNYDKIPAFHYFQKVNKGYLKILNVKDEKLPDFSILLFC